MLGVMKHFLLPLLLCVAAAIYTSGCKDRPQQQVEDADNTVFSRVTHTQLGLDFAIPKKWEITTDTTERSFELTIEPSDRSFILIQSRYIEERPEGIENHRQWVELQFSEHEDAGEITLDSITPQDVKLGSCMKIQFTQKSPEGKVFCYALNYMNQFENPEYRRMWIMSASSLDDDFLKSENFKRFLKSISITNFNWELN